MAYFKDLNDKIVYITNMVKANQDLCKLLYYSENNPLDFPDIFDTQTLMLRNIFPLPKSPESVKEQISILNVYFLNSKNYSKNTGFRPVYLVFDIMCHLDIWMLNNNQIRPLSICSKIDEMFNNVVIQQVSDAAIFWDGLDMYKFSDYYYGYRLTYKISESSNMGCG